MYVTLYKTGAMKKLLSFEVFMSLSTTKNSENVQFVKKIGLLETFRVSLVQPTIWLEKQMKT